MRLTHFFGFAAVLASVVLPSHLAASITYLVTANTSGISGQSGYLDLQLEPGPSATNLATATVTHFSGTGALSGSATLTGDVTGQLPGTLSFDNKTVFNDYFQGMTFGTTESFDVTLNGPSPAGGAESAFNISFYASDQSTSLLTVSPDGDAGQITINPDGSTAPSTYAATVNGASALSITLVQPLNTVPEPSGFAFLALGTAFAILRKHIGNGAGSVYASGSVSQVPGGGEFSTMEKRRDESRRGRHECLRHSLARVAFDFFTPSKRPGPALACYNGSVKLTVVPCEPSLSNQILPL